MKEIVRNPCAALITGAAASPCLRFGVSAIVPLVGLARQHPPYVFKKRQRAPEEETSSLETPALLMRARLAARRRTALQEALAEQLCLRKRGTGHEGLVPARPACESAYLSWMTIDPPPISLVA